MHGVVSYALGIQSCTSTGAMDQVNRCLFEDASANSGKDIILSLAFQHNIIDASQIKETPKKQTRRTCPDNNNLFTHLPYRFRLLTLSRCADQE